MAEYSDLGTHIMKLFDPLIAEAKEKLRESQENYIREMPRKLGNRTSISPSRAEEFVRDISDRLIRINQDLLNQYSISIAKKVRSYNKELSQSLTTNLEELNQRLEKKDREIEGLIARATALEQRTKTLDQEKAETLSQFSDMNKTIKELESRLGTISEEYSYQINQLNTEWEKKFQKSQEEWDSYLKLKLAEKEVSNASLIQKFSESE